jgi:hypothetical protein
MRWNWRDEGFGSEPRSVTLHKPARIFRVWGGQASKAGSPHRAGVCFSMQKPLSRKWAERLFSVWEWGNACIWVTTFDVKPGTTLFVGSVDVGDAAPDLADRRGVQVFIENPVAGTLREIVTERLTHDLDAGWVFVGPPSSMSH